ncbi:hypothetical protein D915_007826, partial [Fasciola hepatica]
SNDFSQIEFTIKAIESGTSSDSLINCVALSGYHLLENSRIRYQFTRKEDKKVIKRLKRESDNLQMKVLGDILPTPLNEPVNARVQVTVPRTKLLEKFTMTVTCGNCPLSDKAQCTADISNTEYKEYITLSAYKKDRKSQFHNGQQNQVHLQWDSIELKENNTQDLEMLVVFSVSIRLSNCAETKNGDNISVPVNGDLGGEPVSSTIAIPVYRKENTEKVDLKLKMMANCSDVYPGDKVDISATISHSSQSKEECDSITMVLHNGPWVSKVDLTSKGSAVLWNDNSDIRLFVQHTSRLYFESEIIVSARVQFAKEFGLPNNAKLKLISFTLEIDCNLMSNIRGNITVPSYTTANVVLHRSRDAYTNLIVPSVGPITDCRVRTWTIDMFVTPRSQHRQNPEVHVPHINLDMGVLSTFYYVRINLTTTNSITFRSQILMTTDGRSYTPVEEISFARHRNHTHSC